MTISSISLTTRAALSVAIALSTACRDGIIHPAPDAQASRPASTPNANARDVCYIVDGQLHCYPSTPSGAPSDRRTSA